MAFELPQGTIAATRLSDLSQKEEQSSLVPDNIRETVKNAKIKDPEMEMIQGLISKGISPLTDPTKFLSAFGATAEQAGIARTWGPLDKIRELVSPDFQNLKAKQQGLLQLGTLLHGEMAKQFASRAQGPQTLADAESVAPGVIQPLESQRLGAPLGPRDQGPIAPFDPQAKLEPFQQVLAAQTAGNLAEGKLMQTPEGIVPTSFSSMQGRRVTPEEVDFLQRAAVAAPGQEIAAPQMSIQPTVATTAANLLGQMNRQIALGPSLNNRLESLTAVESAKKFGAPMRFQQLAQRDPALAEKLRQQADVQEAKDIISFQNLEGMKRNIAQAAPVESAKLEARKDQPVDQPQLWRDPISGVAAKATMTTRQAQNQNFVKLRPDQIETLNQMETIDRGLEEVKEISQRLLSPKRKTALGEGWRALSQSAKLSYLRATGDPDVLKMDSIITRLTAPLVKSQGDTANIAVAEREMFAQSLVNNRASTEAVIANLDNVISTTKSVRKMMGFSNKDDFEAALLESGMKSSQAADLAKKRFKNDADFNQREQIRALRAQGKSWTDIEKILTKKR